ncbi:MAG: zinc ABC transporter substrate-binding protein [Chloroflexi bacterium]|nr:zinc ABC transporter substrate-binding protein [Chloroflexota bacterium]
MLRALAISLAVVTSLALAVGCDLGERSTVTPPAGGTQEAPGAKPASAPTTAPAAQPAKPAAVSSQAPAASAKPQASAAPTGPKLKVVATFSVLGDLVKQVGGDRVDLAVIVGPEGDAHTFEPSPADVASLAGAALIFENGLEFEPWLEKIYPSSQSKTTRVIVTEGLSAPIRVEEHGEYDPHVWHDVQNAMHMVRVIRDALVAADAANAATYRANAEKYLAELQQLDSWIAERVKALPEGRRKLVTAHDTFEYFARRYGFAIVGTALGSVSTEVADPAAAKIAALINEIKAAGVPAIFAENVSNPRLMQRIASEAGVTLVTDLYTDALGKPGTPGDTYAKMLRSNVEKIVSALSR